MSNGRFIIDSFPGGAIVPATEEVEGMRTGVIDFSNCGWYHKSLDPAASLFGQVSGGPSSVQYGFWFESLGGRELSQEGLGRFGITFLEPHLLVPEDWAYTTVSLETVADLKKLKMRTFGEGGEILDRLGASTVFIPGGEVYESAQRGVINAFEYGSASSAWDMGFHEVMDYCYLSLSRAPADMAWYGCRTESYQALPDDLKAILQAACRSEIWTYYAEAVANDALVLQKFRDYGVQVLPLPKVIEDAFLAEAKAFFDEKMKTEGDFYARVLQSLRDAEETCDQLGIY